MPRKAFVADIAGAAVGEIDGVSHVVKGDDDGDVNFCYTPSTGVLIEIGLLALDVSGYPSESSFMIFARSSDIPPRVADALESIAENSSGMGLLEIIETISRKLKDVLNKPAHDMPSPETSDIEEAAEDLDEESEGEDAYMYSDDDAGFESALTKDTLSNHQLSPENAAKLNCRIKEDLRAARLAGYKIGPLSGLKADSPNSIVSISMQAAKLGLSDEVFQAWDLEPSQYIVLLVKYSCGYKAYDTVISDAASSLGIAFRIGVSNRYKPTLLEALAAFSESKGRVDESVNVPDEAGPAQDSNPAGFSSLFISSSLNGLLNGQFISLVKIRHALGISWDEAKKFYGEKRGRMDDQRTNLSANLGDKMTPHASAKPEKRIGSDELGPDHMAEEVDQLSFPLIAIQLAMRYFLRCTEFCLVCHDKIDHGFEALKPYVCDKPLCLYQYMSLGFGPSVEHEILTQPYVVDLLVSFCYSSAMGRRLREYPTGMALMVPPTIDSVTQPTVSRGSVVPPQESPSTPETIPLERNVGTLGVKYDAESHEIVFDADKFLPIKRGDWVIIAPGRVNSHLHYRVEDTSCFPTVKLSLEPIAPGKVSVMEPPRPSKGLKKEQAPLTPALAPATLAIYELNFDELSEQDKCEAIVLLLDTLPSLKEMTAYLAQQCRSSEPSLRMWKERISPAALGLLRWIIASNRSCIVQVDSCPGQAQSGLGTAKMRPEQKVLNVATNWVQFRFAQGSPDKEQRFLKALKDQKDRLPPEHPTIFAFHGSPIQNWHSIIRSGLDFNQTLHGRAYGHGVYHAQDQTTSIGYTGVGGSTTMCWPGSELRPIQAMSLNEIVNCPDQFQSKTPYLVVQHVDWIQCRYLFVQGSNAGEETLDGLKSEKTSSPAPEVVDHIDQDPKFTAKSTTGTAISVPQCATLISRAFRVSMEEDTKSRDKKAKYFSGHLSIVSIADSEEEDPSDIKFLLSDDEDFCPDGKGSVGKLVVSNNLDSLLHTDFIPGSLDQSLLPMLEPPTYATSSATMRLNRELKTILDIQKRTLLHELGWFIDANLVTNVYQWIVELHSFDASLPLAKDMKAAGVTSIVLEIRFGKDYPHSPPFVRVIRPRFLPFMNGGGGHVTAGGAMCMELLTNSGWSAVSSIESVLLQVRMAIMNLEPKPARLENQSRGGQREYGTGEAMEAFVRVCKAHGWEVPKDFQDFAGGSRRGAS